eukprot:NODE_357_length_8846_cov_0.279410.p4 type:complete len:192 gc:universal NODE_357_length_8846_cov_0.279410:6105-5530(-)
MIGKSILSELSTFDWWILQWQIYEEKGVVMDPNQTLLFVDPSCVELEITYTYSLTRSFSTYPTQKSNVVTRDVIQVNDLQIKHTLFASVANLSKYLQDYTFPTLSTFVTFDISLIFFIIDILCKLQISFVYACLWQTLKLNKVPSNQHPYFYFVKLLHHPTICITTKHTQTLEIGILQLFPNLQIPIAIFT